MDPDTLSYVFISYSRLQQAYARSLAAHLTRYGIQVWFDDKLITGDRWENVIKERIDQCAALVVVMSRDAEVSTWVSREIIRAEDKGKPMLPLLFDGKVFFQLAHLQFENVRGGVLPGERFIAALRQATGTAADVPHVTTSQAAEPTQGEVTRQRTAALSQFASRTRETGKMSTSKVRSRWSTRLPHFPWTRSFARVSIPLVLLLLAVWALLPTIDRGRGGATLGSSDGRLPASPSLSPSVTVPSEPIEGAEPLPEFASGPPPADYTFKKAELRSYFCPDYGTLSSCTRPAAGYAVLIVWLLPAGPGHSSDLGVETDKLIELNAFVIEPTGNPTACTSSGGESDGGAPTKLYLLFVVPNTAKNFTLVVRNTTWQELNL